MSEKDANMSHWRPKTGAGACRDRALARPAGEGDQALQVLDDGAQDELALHSSQTAPSSSRESMLILAFGEEVLASDAEFATDLVALCLMDLPDPVPGLSLLQLSVPGPLPLQVERAPLPGRQLLCLLAR